MRTRVWLTGVVLGAALLTGGTVATAQAASASSDASTIAAGYTDIGTFPSLSACQSFGAAGVYSDWYCKKSTTTSNYHLWVNLDS
ncbi:hypothetical protein GCM10018793_67700 [Streptomyces sulfonofaciens]|uniref:Uncharacterized protein n=1 Tax=Streptomyces sulfonofaciens TaxID=68272 RepID=A0A919LAZ3_9ACTN|nr:hypothetical protein [Streptomyces sulfonofaciens]GHH88346.1 hypothetical protein GCM10018793_67700 [Streptomyces sulfonofaciens]